MKEERYFYVPNAEDSDFLPEDEAIHATRVLRMKEGDTCYILNGRGNIYTAEITLASHKKCSYHITGEITSTRNTQDFSKTGVHIVMAPTKMMERVEWLAEKATEVGIDSITFLDCKFSERKHIRTDRIEKIIVSAMKQSHKIWKPKVEGLVSFNDFISREREGLLFICHCYNEIERVNLFDTLRHSSNSEQPVTILIGPEGDFSIDEVKEALKHGYKSVSLGESRLRTETAALAGIMMAHLAKRQ